MTMKGLPGQRRKRRPSSEGMQIQVLLPYSTDPKLYQIAENHSVQLLTCFINAGC